MRRLAIAFVFLLTAAAATPASAAEPAKAAAKQETLAVRLARLTIPEKQWNEVLDAIESSQAQMLAQLPGSESEHAQKAIASMQRKVRALMPYAEMLDLQAGLFAKYYTEPELQELYRFYESALGRKTLQLTPEITRDVMAAVQTRMVAELPRLMKELEAELAQD